MINKKTTVSIIVPAFNESERLGQSICVILDYLNKENFKSELLVVDDGSKDATAKVAEESFANAGSVAARVIRYEQNRGKGYAVKTGLLAAQGEIALFTDADLSTPITEMPKLVDPIKRGEVDLAFGSRALDRSLIGVHQPWRREQGGRVFNLVVRLATGLPFWDTQCGFKAFRMSVCRTLAETATIERFGFDVELLFIAHLAGLRLQEIPVRWDHNDGSKVSVLRDSQRMFNEVRLIRGQARKGVYAQGVKSIQEAARRELIARNSVSNEEENSEDEAVKRMVHTTSKSW